jgi:eukaryotic-like serine/threonine-protein kinase
MGSQPIDQLAYDDEKPQRFVYLDAYWISRTEVTNAMYTAFVESTGHVTGAEGRGWMFYYDIVEANLQRMNGADWRYPYGPDFSWDRLEEYPVVGIDWIDAQMYCNWVGGRLPTEAEWEKAARGTSGLLYPWGHSPLTGRLANIADSQLRSEYSDMSINDGYPLAAPVGYYPDGASPYGVLDMAGNAWEWVFDWYSTDYYASARDENPAGPERGDFRVIRGGGWNGVARLARTTNRGYAFPDVPTNLIGFRCIIEDGG